MTWNGSTDHLVALAIGLFVAAMVVWPNTRQQTPPKRVLAPSNGVNPGAKSPESKDKGKGKSAVTSPDVSMEEEEEEEDDDDDDDDDEDDEEMEEDDDDDEEEHDPEIDPSMIISGGRRTRGVKVDYASKEAHEKAGLKPEDEDEDEMK